jgi:cell division protein FtsX
MERPSEPLSESPGRLKPAVSLPAAESSLARLAHQLSEQFPQTNADHSVRLVTLVDDLMSGSRQFVLLQVGAAGFVLLLASANVANLQLARRMSRQREVAVRMALGAEKWRLARLVLVESLLLAALGGAVGLVLASWGLALARQAIPTFVLQHLSGLKQLQVDGRVAAFTVLIALAAGCLTVTVQWVRTRRASLSEMLKQSGMSGVTSQSDRLRGGLVIGEVALAMILLVGAGLMVHGFRTL